MREILFRGKRKDTKEWIEGYLIIIDNHYWIVKNSALYDNNPDGSWKLSVIAFEVIPETVGQYTGLKDKNGKMIFEGDIFRTAFPDCMAVVTWDAECARFIGYTLGNERKIVYVGRVDKHNRSAVEVIGNIHDNPELLKEGDK